MITMLKSSVATIFAFLSLTTMTSYIAHSLQLPASIVQAGASRFLEEGIKIVPGNKRLEGTHALTSEDVTELALGGSGKFVLVTEFFYGGVLLVDVENKTFDYIVPPLETFAERGSLGVFYTHGHILVAGGGPLVGLPFEIYIYDPTTSDLVTTCKPSSDVEVGLFNDIDVVGDVAYVTDSTQNRLWDFNIHQAIEGDCVLEYQELNEEIFLGVEDTLIRSNGIHAYGDGFLISLFDTGGLYYVEPAANVTSEVIPLGTLMGPDGLELVVEEDGTETLYISAGGSDNLLVYKLSMDEESGDTTPKATSVGKIENEYYDQPATSAVIGDMIYTANIRLNTLGLPATNEDKLDVFNETFAVIGASRAVLSDASLSDASTSPSMLSATKSVFSALFAALFLFCM